MGRCLRRPQVRAFSAGEQGRARAPGAASPCEGETDGQRQVRARPWGRRVRTGRISVLRGAAAGCVIFLGGCAFGGSPEGAVARGDEAWAKGDREEALAEYRLALGQGTDDAAVWLRVAHAYTTLGRVDEAREPYLEATRRDPALVDQAVSDLVRLARDSERRRDRFRVAQAIQLALELQPGISVPDLAGPLAAHHASMGDYARAIPFYQRALTTMDGPSRGALIFELAVAHEQIGDCERAILQFEQFRETRPAWDRAKADFHIGSCSFDLALRARAAGELDEAERLIAAVIRLGEPRAQLPRAWFEYGEIRAALGQCAEALDAFRRVRETDGSGNSPLVARAQDRIDQIRFPGRRVQFTEGGC
jgi:tetratricopeptide (TPR) repeat protein